MTTGAEPQTITYTSDGRVNLKCRTCQHRGSLTYTTTTVMRAFNGRPTSTTYLTAEDRTHRSYLGPGVDVKRLMHRPCTCGSSAVTVAVVKGSHNPDKRCDTRCEHTTGPNCDCSCAGSNHGAGNGTWA